MSPIGNGHDRQTTVGLDIGACTITCAIGQIIPETKRVKLLGISDLINVQGVINLDFLSKLMVKYREIY